ncbi:MAG: MBL fold metallo-hydrolase [Candidatus Micrarchaeia archaeon]|jgi:7,8-dihydropterin-6-yl-methyl-4-(beta-D-ribofuranosyl)aminobenzene 5'-phosphate synthase
MRITVLNDEKPGRCPAEHGLSFLIDCGKKILFDVGPSEIFVRNASELGIDLNEVETIVLSHGHWDHTNGLKYINGKKLVAHPDCFAKRFRKKDKKYNGVPITRSEAGKQFTLVLSKKPHKLSDDVIFLGEIPRLNDFEAKKTEFYLEDGTDDFILGDSALAIKTGNGLVVVAGCSHAGICNIIEHAKRVSGERKIYAVIGGFHLLQYDEAAKKTIEYFKKERIARIFPSHCVSEAVIDEMSKEFKISRMHSGDVIDI